MEAKSFLDTETIQKHNLDQVSDKSIRLKKALSLAVNQEKADALMLSGGIDSSILAALDKTVPAYTVVLDGHGVDLRNAQRVAEHLGLKWCTIEISVDEAIANLIELIQVIKSFDIGILNDLALYVGIKYSASMGARVIRTGDFADTLFKGYEYLWSEENFTEYLTKLIPQVRLSSSRIIHSMGLIPNYPYLHPAVIDASLSLTDEDNLINLESSVSGDFAECIKQNAIQSDQKVWSKMALRRSALGLLPIETIFRTKTDLEFGSGMYLLVNKLEQMITEDQFSKLKEDGHKFWNKAHAALYTIFRDFGCSSIPPQSDQEYACNWCCGGVPKGRSHCMTCGAWPSNK